MEEADEYCPHCDNHYIIPAKTPKEKKIVVDLEGGGDMFDDRMKRKKQEKTDIIIDL